MPSALRSPEGRLATVLAAAAALRVFLFASAFPFVSNVDEHMHVDAVLKYARGYRPAPDTAAYEPEMPALLGIYGSPEYHIREEVKRERGVAPPPWARGAERMAERVEYNRGFLANRANLEAYQPPLYYALTGAWLALGRGFGLEGARLLYWARQLHALFAFALVLATYLYLRPLYPGDPFVRLGVPALLAAFPLDVFYYLTPDALSPLLAGLGFFAAVAVAREPVPDGPSAAAAGAVVAAALLVKYTNAPLLPVLAAGTAVALRRREGARRLRGEGGRLLVLWAAAVLPVAAWMARNRAVFGDWSGTAFKLRRMGWSTRPFAEWWDHPILTPGGAAHFLSELVPSFWRGELVWAREALAAAPVDWFYTATTAIAVAAVAIRWPRRAGDARTAEGLALFALAASAFFLGALSLPFAFPENGVPGAADPFFFQGRLASGAIAPFALVYVRGLQVVAAPLGRAARAGAWALLGVALAVAVGSEVALSREVFASAYNWYRLPW